MRQPTAPETTIPTPFRRTPKSWRSALVALVACLGLAGPVDAQTAPPNAIVWDTFTGTGNTPLGSHTPDHLALSGQPWIKGVPTSAALVQGGKVLITGPGTAGGQPWGILTTHADVIVAAEYTSTNGDLMGGGLVVRAVDGNNYIALVTEGTTLKLLKKQSGAFSSLAPPATSPIVSGTTYRYEVRTKGSSIKVYLNGVLVISAPDVTFQANAMRHGVLFESTDLTTKIDNFSVVPNTRPIIDLLTPETGSVGTNVRIDGANFGTTGSRSVMFNAVPASEPAWGQNGDTVTVTVPAGVPLGSVAVTVTVSGTQSDPKPFTVIPPPAPVIDEISPSAGSVGSQVTIVGTNFGTNLSTVTATFNSVPADVAWGSATTLTATVPAGLTMGPVNVVVTVDGASSLPESFTVIPPPAPSITDVTPGTGPVGKSVTITGTNFGTGSNTRTVKFNNVQAEQPAWGTGTVTTTVPVGLPTGPANVVVTVDGVPSTPWSFTVIPAPVPEITLISPSSAKPGSPVTIQGANFGTAGSTRTVKFNNVQAEQPAWGTDTVTATVPAGVAAGPGTVVVTVDGVPDTPKLFYVIPSDALVWDTFTGEDAALGSHTPDFLALSGQPWIKGASTSSAWLLGGKVGITIPGTAGRQPWGIQTNVPDVIVAAEYTSTSGAPKGGLIVRAIDGNNYIALVTDGPKLALYKKQSSGNPVLLPPEATPPIVSGTTYRYEVRTKGSSIKAYLNGVLVLSATETALMTATRHGVLFESTDTTARLDNFSVVPNTKPLIDRVMPGTASVGTSVLIEGANFGTTGSRSVKFNGVEAINPTWGADTVTADVPALATTGDIVVTIDGVDSDPRPFTVAPKIDSITPQSGAVGDSVTVAGKTFGTSSGTVKFNGVTAATTDWTPTSFRATVPAGATTGNVVVTAAGVDSDGFPFTVSPRIDELSRSSGSVGTSVTITGTNFGTNSDTRTVTFNSVVATDFAWATNGTSVTVKVPAGVLDGSVNVVVTVGGVPSNGRLFIVGTFISTVVHDTFTGNGSSLTSHVPDTSPAGATWTPYIGMVPKLANGAVSSNATGPDINTGSGHESAFYQSGVADGTVAVDFKPSVTPTIFGLGVRKNASGYLLLKYNSTEQTPKLELWHFNGSWGMFAACSGNAPALDTNWHRIKVSLDGSTISAVLDQQPIFTCTDITTNQAATEHGLMWDLQVEALGVFDNFDVTVSGPMPSISGLNPAGGPVGSSVAIAGSNLGTSRGTNTVRFSGVPATEVIWGTDGTSLTATVPVGASTGNVVVTVDGVSSTGFPFTVTTPSNGVVYDTFTGANNSSLSGHLPDTGLAGVAWTSLAGAVPVMSNGTVTSNTAGPCCGSTFESAVVASGLANSYVGVDFKPSSAVTEAGLTLRATDATHFLALRYSSNGSAAALNLYEYGTLVRTVPAPVINTNWHRLEARLEGSSITGILDGVPLLNHITGYNQTGSQYGLYWNLNVDPGVAFDFFQVTELSGAPNVPPDARVFDEFTISGTGQSMAGRVPMISYAGAPWILYQGIWPTLNGSKVVPSSSGPLYAVTVANSGTSNGTVYADFQSTAANRRVGLALRVNNADNMLVLQYTGNWSSGRVELLTRINGIFKTLAGVSVGPLDGQHRLEAWMNGLSVTASLDGMPLFNYYTNDNLTSTRHGLFWWPSVDGTAAVDRFAVNGVTPNLPFPDGTICEATLSDWQFAIDDGGGTVELEVTMPNSGCTWTGRMLGGSPNSMIVTPAVLPTFGSRTVQFEVGNAASPYLDVLHASIAGHLVYIFRAGEEEPIGTCGYTMSPSSLGFQMGGGSKTITVTPSNSRCAWTVSPDYRTVEGAGWIGISDGSIHSGLDPVDVTITVPPNNQMGERTAYLTIGNQKEFVIHQDGDIVCPAPTVGAETIDAPASGDSFTVDVYESEQCGWNVLNPAPDWLEITKSSDNPTGNGSVTIRVINNTHPFSRTARIEVIKPESGSAYITITQAGDGAADVQGEISYYHTDPLGSVRLITNEAGAVVSSFDYTPFGQLFSGSTTPTAENRVLFTGKERDDGTKTTALDPLYYSIARYYQGQIGRFTSVDPGHVGGNLFDPQSWNGYVYARNNPLGLVDPLGLVPCKITFTEEAVAEAKGVPLGTEVDGDCEVAKGTLGSDLDFALWALREAFKETWDQLTYNDPNEIKLGIFMPAGTRGPPTVIGRMSALENLAEGEVSLASRLKHNLGTPKANWRRNFSELRREMRRGEPIRDASPRADKDGPWLNAERRALEYRGWGRYSDWWRPRGQ